MFPGLITIGPLRLSIYAMLLSIGLLGSVLLSLSQSARTRLARARAFDAALLGASGGLIGARAAYVAINGSYYRDHLLEAVRLGAGGLAWQGGLVLGLLLVLLYGMRGRVSPGILLDTLTPGLAWFTLFIWLGSAVTHDIFGQETFPGDGVLWMLSADLPDLYGFHAPRVNVSLLGTIWSGLVFGALWITKERSRTPGTLCLMYLALTGLGGVWLVPLQANAVPYIFRVRLDWLFNSLLVSGGLLGLFFSRLRFIKERNRIANRDL